MINKIPNSIIHPDRIVIFYFQSEVDVEVKKLLALKAEYKSATGNDWKPGAHSPQKPAPQPTAAAPPSQSNTNMDAAAQALKDKIDAQGTKVRELKGSGAAKVRIYYLSIYTHPH